MSKQYDGWESASESVTKALRQRRMSVQEAVHLYLDRISDAHPSDRIADLRTIDWNADVPPFSRWLFDSLKFGQISDDVAALWFSVPEVDCGVTSSYFVGCSYFDPKDEDWASDVIWTQEREAADARQTPGSHPIEFEPPAMHAARVKLGLENEDDEQNIDDEIMICIGLVLVYFAALIHETLPAIDRKLTLGGRAWRGVGYGFISGELQLAGVLTPEGLVKPGKVHKTLPPDA